MLQSNFCILYQICFTFALAVFLPAVFVCRYGSRWKRQTQASRSVRLERRLVACGVSCLTRRNRGTWKTSPRTRYNFVKFLTHTSALNMTGDGRPLASICPKHCEGPTFQSSYFRSRPVSYPFSSHSFPPFRKACSLTSTQCFEMSSQLCWVIRTTTVECGNSISSCWSMTGASANGKLVWFGQTALSPIDF